MKTINKLKMSMTSTRVGFMSKKISNLSRSYSPHKCDQTFHSVTQ